MTDVETVIDAWKPYIDGITDWQRLVVGVSPKQSGCGPIYELPNPIERPGEDFAIADMRDLAIAEPHYHPAGVHEIYFVLTGTGRLYAADKEIALSPGVVIAIEPLRAHYTIPVNDLVVAVVDTPPFEPAHYIALSTDNSAVHFDKAAFDAYAKGLGK